MKNSVVIIRMSNKIRMLLYNWLSIFHSNTKSGYSIIETSLKPSPQHIIELAVQTDTVEQFLQRVGFVNFLWHNL